MATVEFKAHLNDDGSIVRAGFQNIVFDRYEMPDRHDVVISAADRFIDEHLLLMSQKLAGEVFYAASIYVDGEFVCSFSNLNTVGRAYLFIEVPSRFKTVRELKSWLDLEGDYMFGFIEPDGSISSDMPPLDSRYVDFSVIDSGDTKVVLVSLSVPSLAETMQNIADLTDEFNDFCDTMLDGLRG